MMTISLLATTDVHGYIDEGLGDLKGLKASLGADLLIDNGDFFIGSSLATFAYVNGGESPLVGIANDIGYDVMIPGNHDLDFGLDWLISQVNGLEADYVCANLFDTHMQLVFEPYTIKVVNGIKVAVIGLLTGAFNRLTTRSSVLDVVVKPPIKVLNSLIIQIKDMADLIVVAYHGGITNNPVTGEVWTYPSSEDEAYQLMEQFPEIDSLICGHQHFINAGIHPRNIALVQPGTQGKVVGYQAFSLNQESKVEILENKIIQLTAQEFPLDNRSEYEDWLETEVDLAKVSEYITTAYPADFHFLNYTAETLDDLIADTQGPFPLSRYYLSGEELAEYLDLAEVINTSKNYTVIASPGILPEYRIREQYLIPLFDKLVTHQAY